MAPGDRAGRVPGSLDTLDLLADLARGRAERVNADLAVRHAGAQRAYLGCGVVLRHAEAERLALQLGEIRLDLGSGIAPACLVLVGGGAQRRKADLGIGEARAHMGKLLGGVALALAQLGGLRLDLGELCRQGSDAVLECHGSFSDGVAAKLARGDAVGANDPQHHAGARCERQTDGDTERGGRAAMRQGIRRQASDITRPSIDGENGLSFALDAAHHEMAATKGT